MFFKQHVAKEKIIFSFLCFGPGKENYLRNLKSWYEKNRGIKCIIIYDSSLPAKEGEALYNLKAKLFSEGINADLIDIEEAKDYGIDLSYSDWLNENIECHKKKPPYAFISDHKRFAALLLLSKKYPEMERIFIAEADTYCLGEKFLKQDLLTSANGFQIFGIDRALILLEPKKEAAITILNKYQQAYSNLYYHFLLPKIIFNNFTISQSLISTIMRYQGNKELFSEYMRQLNQITHYEKTLNEDKPNNNLVYFLSFQCGLQIRHLLNNYYSTLSPHQVEYSEEAIAAHLIDSTESLMGYCHASDGDWRTLKFSIKDPVEKSEISRCGLGQAITKPNPTF